MQGISDQQLLFSVLALGLILLLARACGELSRRAGQPEVLGEITAGFLLGPSVFGALALPAYRTLFLSSHIAPILSAASWLGAILLLLVAGMEVDVGVLRAQLRPGMTTAAFAIIPSLVAGVIFGGVVLGNISPTGFFLGIVLSVSAVSVAAKILIERDATRRDFGQIVLAAGVASEVAAWLLVSVASPQSGASPVATGAEHLVFAAAFFACVFFVGRRFVFWLMRRVGDGTVIVNGQLSLVLVLTLFAAALTQSLGLHALLGAFVLGVVIGQAPRANEQLLGNVQSLTIGLFAPLFFALAGMRIDILHLATPHSVVTMLLLLVTATVVKVGFATVGSRLGGGNWWQAAIIGVSVNLRGGTDVVVAIVGVELGLLSTGVYTMYAIVAALTVLLSPAVMTLLEKRLPISAQEQARLDAEEAEKGAYTRSIERVLVPMIPRVIPTLASTLVEQVARSKHDRGQVFDITEFVSEPQSVNAELPVQAHAGLQQVGTLPKVELTRTGTDSTTGSVDAIVNQSDKYDLIAVGSRRPRSGNLSLGHIADSLIGRAHCDILIVASSEDEIDCDQIQRILVPLNGLEYSMAAGDLAASIGQACNADLTAFHVVQSGVSDLFWRQRDRKKLVAEASQLAEELGHRVRRLGVSVEERVEIDDNIAHAILTELGRGRYQLVVLGAVTRGAEDLVSRLGATVEAVLRKSPIPVALLVARQNGLS